VDPVAAIQVAFHGEHEAVELQVAEELLILPHLVAVHLQDQVGGRIEQALGLGQVIAVQKLGGGEVGQTHQQVVIRQVGV